MNKKINKKLLLSLGTIVSIAAPVAAVVACGSNKKNEKPQNPKNEIPQNPKNEIPQNPKNEIPQNPVVHHWYDKMLSSGENGWNEFLHDSRNNFDDEFITKAKEAIDWSNSNNGEVVVLQNAFKDIVLPQGFELPSTVTKIEHEAFFKATLPKGFVIPSSYTIIGPYAFHFSILPDDFIIPETVTKIGGGSFASSTLPKDFIIPQTVKWVGHAAFKDAIIKTDDGYTIFNAFLRKNNGDIIYLNTPYLSGPLDTIVANSFNGIAFPDGFTIPSIVTTIGSKAFTTALFPKGFTIPSTVTSIADDAFINSMIKTDDGYTIFSPDGSEITEVPDNFFQYTTLPQGFELPSTVTSIGNGVFKSATLPQGFTIPSGVTSIGNGAFEYAKLPDGFTIP